MALSVEVLKGACRCFAAFVSENELVEVDLKIEACSLRGYSFSQFLPLVEKKLVG